MPIEKLYIKKDNENEFEIHDKVDGLTAMGITKNAPQLNPKVKQINGTDGELTFGASYNPLTIKIKVYLAGQDVYDYKLLVSELYRLLYSKNPVRIRDEVEPNICYYGYVKPPLITSINFTNATAEIEFLVPSGFRQSIKNSDELAGTDYQFGMNETNNDDLHNEIKYEFNSDTFWVYNDSDVLIDPYKNRHELTIKLNCDGQPTIKNDTTDTSIALNQNMKSSDTFMLKGVDSFLNNNPCGINTDMGYITLAKGWNKFEVNGASNININFSFPFLYL